MSTSADAAALAVFWAADVPPDAPIGLHDAVVTAARLDVSRAGHSMIVAQLRTADGRFHLPPLYLSLNPKARVFLEATLRALGVVLAPGTRVRVSAAELLGRSVPIRIERDKDSVLRSRAESVTRRAVLG
jgi:hypothetical protein